MECEKGRAIMQCKACGSTDTRLIEIKEFSTVGDGDRCIEYHECNICHAKLRQGCPEEQDELPDKQPARDDDDHWEQYQRSFEQPND